MMHLFVIFLNRVVGYSFNFVIIPYCVLENKNYFVRFYILSLVLKAFYDSATLFYPFDQKKNNVLPSRFLSVIVQFRLLIALLMLPFAFLYEDFIIAIIYVISCILSMEFYFNLENDSRNLFIHSNLVKFVIVIVLLTLSPRDADLVRLFVLSSLIVSLYGFLICKNMIHWKPERTHLTDFKEMFYLTVPAVLNFGSREAGLYLIYENISKGTVLSDRVQKSVLSLTSSLGPLSVAFHGTLVRVFFRFKYLWLFSIPLVLSSIFLLYIYRLKMVEWSTSVYLVSLYFGSLNYLIQLFYFGLKGRFKEIYRLNILYGVLGISSFLFLKFSSLFNLYPFVMLIQEIFLLCLMICYLNLRNWRY